MSRPVVPAPFPRKFPYARWLIALAAAPLVGGAVTVFAFWAQHIAGYHGICGPDPPDIPAHPCPFQVYAADFWNPFALIGLFMVSVLGGGALFVIVLTAFVIASTRFDPWRA